MNPAIKKTFFTIGLPFSPFYSQLMVFRSFLYRKRIFKTHRLSVPVVSVGNLTMGGTGKTPLVMYLVKQLAAQGYKPAVVSRGYRGKSDAEVNIVSDGTKILMEAEQCGDEPWLLANELSGVVVATGKNRFLPCQEVIQSYKCDIIVLDDGFQHLKLFRTIDLVLFDADVFAGNSRVFPGGELREPVSALNRCSAFVLTGVTRSNIRRSEKCAEILLKRFQDKDLFQFTGAYNRAFHYVSVNEDLQRKTVPVSELPENLYCFCGIANPQRFSQLLLENGIMISGFKTFDDHHYYTDKDLDELVNDAHSQNAPGFLTTEKDISKIKNLFRHKLAVFTLPVEFNQNQDFNNFIKERLVK
jgi:tetraacyldisaccharide 4'-kinase